MEYFGKFGLFTEYFFILIIFVYFPSVALFFVYPAYMYFVENELVFVVPLFIPGIDENTTTGYVIVLVYHIFIFVLSVAGVIAIDYLFGVIIVSSLMFAKLIHFEIEQIHVDLQEKNATFLVRGRFLNILQMHQEMIR